MNPLAWPLLVDENLDERVVLMSRERGLDIRTVAEENLLRENDRRLLRHAAPRGWAVLTQDMDFGTLAIRDGEPYVGIISIRPGDLHPDVVMLLLETLHASAIVVVAPFIVVVELRGGRIRIRIRSPLV